MRNKQDNNNRDNDMAYRNQNRSPDCVQTKAQEKKEKKIGPDTVDHYHMKRHGVVQETMIGTSKHFT